MHLGRALPSKSTLLFIALKKMFYALIYSPMVDLNLQTLLKQLQSSIFQIIILTIIFYKLIFMEHNMNV